MSASQISFDFSIPSTVVVSVPANDTVLGCFHTIDEIRKRLQRDTRDLKLCIFRSLPGLPFVSSITNSIPQTHTTGSSTALSTLAAANNSVSTNDVSPVEHIAKWDRLLQHFRRFKFITVAVMDGELDDVALSFSLACDFAVATPNSCYVAPQSMAMLSAADGGARGLPFWSLSSLGMHVGVGNAKRILTSSGLSHAELKHTGILLQVLTDSGLDTLGVFAESVIKTIPNRKGRTHMQTRNGLISSFAIKAGEHIGHCLAVMNVNVDAALESDPKVVYAKRLPSADAVSIKTEEAHILVDVPDSVAIESLGTSALFTLIGRVKKAAADAQCGRVVFRFTLPKATAESAQSNAPDRLVFSGEVQTLMEKESSGNQENAVAGASASSTYKDMRDLQIISVKAFTRFEKFLHSIRALPFVTVAHLAGDGIASSALVQFASMCDLWIGGGEGCKQLYTVCGGGSGQLTPGTLLFRVAKVAGLARARVLALLSNDAERNTAILSSFLIPPTLQQRVLASTTTASQAPHPQFLTAYRRLLQEACHEDFVSFIMRQGGERQKALNIDASTLATNASSSLYDLKQALLDNNDASSLLLIAALKADQLPDVNDLTDAHFASTLTVFVSPANVLSVRFKSGNDLSPMALLELMALFDFCARGAIPEKLSAVALTLPGGGFTQDQDPAAIDSAVGEASRIALAHLQVLVHRCTIPTYVCLSGTIRNSALEIALAFDYRLATVDCALAAPLGGVSKHIPGALFVRLSRSIGFSRLNRLLFAAESEDGDSLLTREEMAAAGLIETTTSLTLLGSSGEIIDETVRRLKDGEESTAANVTCARVYQMRCRRLIEVVPQLSCRQTALQLELFQAETVSHPATLAAAAGRKGLYGQTVNTSTPMSPGRQLTQRRLALHFDDDTNIPIIVLDRASNKNRLDSLMVAMLARLVDHLEKRQYESVVIRSQNASCFCAGIDDKDRGFDPEVNVASLNAVFNKIDEASFVSIALVQGDCAGCGFELAMACDVRVAGPEASFWYPSKENTKHAASNMRNRLVGTLQNEDVLRVLDGKKFNATAAFDVGIVNYLSPDPYAKAVQFAQSFMQKAVQTPAEESKVFNTDSFFNVVSKLATSGGDFKEDQQETKVVSNLSADTVVASTSLRDPFPSYNASVLSIATAVPPDCLYTQAEIAKIMNITDPTLKRLFGASHIRSRNLAGLKDEQKMNIEDITQGYLINKHMKYAKLLARNTIPVACKRAGITLEDVEYIVITTSTGFVLPPLTAQISEMLGLRPSIQRTDIVGMGCHAGLNGMRSAANWVTQRANHGKYAVLACIEVCSAEYVWDPKTMQSRSCLGIAVTNSLFGDGASACVLTCKSPQLDITSSLPAQVLTADAGKRHPTLLGFGSYLIPNSLRSMYMDWQDSQQKYSFLVMPEAPYLIGLCIPRMINKLLDRFSLPIEDVSHWIVHSGGKKVIDQIVYTLGIIADDVRHTVDSLEIAGNVSSGAFLFAYSRLVEEQTVRRGDYGMFITMGPGAGLECCLFRC